MTFKQESKANQSLFLVILAQLVLTLLFEYLNKVCRKYCCSDSKTCNVILCFIDV